MATTVRSSGGVGDHDSIEKAALKIDEALQHDMAYLDMSDLLQVQKQNAVAVTGRVDDDYPSLSSPNYGLGALKQIGSIKKVPLPEELTEQYARILL